MTNSKLKLLISSLLFLSLIYADDINSLPKTNNFYFIVYKTDINVDNFNDNNIQIDNGYILSNIYKDTGNFKLVSKEKILLQTDSSYDSFITNNKLNKTYYSGINTNQSLVYNIGYYTNNELRVDIHHSNYNIMNKSESDNSFSLTNSYQISKNQCLNIYNIERYNDFHYIYLICLIGPDKIKDPDSGDLNK